MKKMIFFVLLSLVGRLIHAQVNGYQEGRLRVQVIDENALPETENTSKSTSVNNIFTQYNVNEYKQALPFAKNPQLLKLYDIVCECNEEQLMSALSAFEGTFFTNFKRMPLPELLYDPVDAFWDGNNPNNGLWFLHKIEANKAWDITKGNRDPYYAVHIIDTPFDPSHPDLINEFVTDIDPFNGTAHAACLIETSGVSYHGTAVAGYAVGETTEVGETSNGGYASVGFNTRFYGYILDWQGLDKALWASNNGAKIISISWHNGACAPDPTGQDQLIVQEILDNGTIIVAAAGNGNCSGGPIYPFSGVYDDRVIQVSSTSKNDEHTSPIGSTQHSHYPEVDLCAPGYEVMRCVPDEFCNTGVPTWPYRDPADGISHSNGTSFATPIVAGTVALMLSVNPDLCPSEAQEILRNTTDPIADANLYPNGVGTGRLNAYKAVREAKSRWDSKNVPPVVGNASWTVNREITGDLVVETGSTLTISSTVSFSKNSKLIVKRGAKLIVNGGTLTKRDCSDYWKGIEVWGNSQLPQPNPTGIGNSSEAGIVVLNGARIEYARTAISTSRKHPEYGWNYPDYWGGVIQATNSTFEFNHRVAEFMKYEFSNLSSFKDCVLLGNIDDETLGVTIWACHDIDFEGNIFESHKSCIYGIDFGADIINSNIFSDSERAIEVFATAPQMQDVLLNIGYTGTTNNTFQNNDVHIQVEAGASMNRMYIYNNDFFAGRHGIWMGGEAKYSIKYNSFGYQSDAAVVAWQNGYPINEVSCNKYELCDYAISANGVNKYFYFRGNEFKGVMSHDLELAQIGSELAQIGLLQGATGNPADNCFSSNLPDNIFAPVGATTQFLYYVPEVPGDPCLIPDNTSGNNYIIDGTFDGPGFCSEDDDFGGNPPTKNDLINKRIAVDNAFLLWQADPGNLELEVAYQNELLGKEKILDFLLIESVRQEDFVETKDLLEEEDSEKAEKLLYGLKLMQNDISGAKLYLNTLPQNTQEEQLFFGIQSINIQRIEEGGDFELSQEQNDFLYQVANSDLKSRAYARSMLALLKGEHFDVSLNHSTNNNAMMVFDNPGNLEMIQEDNQKLSYNIYPNPANNSIRVICPIARSTGWVNLQIIDLQGRVVLNRKFDGIQETTEISTDMLDDGTYVLRILDETNELFQTKLVIIH